MATDSGWGAWLGGLATVVGVGAIIWWMERQRSMAAGPAGPVPANGSPLPVAPRGHPPVPPVPPVPQSRLPQQLPPAVPSPPAGAAVGDPTHDPANRFIALRFFPSRNAPGDGTRATAEEFALDLPDGRREWIRVSGTDPAGVPQTAMAAALGPALAAAVRRFPDAAVLAETHAWMPRWVGGSSTSGSPPGAQWELHLPLLRGLQWLEQLLAAQGVSPAVPIEWVDPLELAARYPRPSRDLRDLAVRARGLAEGRWTASPTHINELFDGRVPSAVRNRPEVWTALADLLAQLVEYTARRGRGAAAWMWPGRYTTDDGRWWVELAAGPGDRLRVRRSNVIPELDLPPFPGEQHR